MDKAAAILGGSLANTTSGAAEINPSTYSLEEKAEMEKHLRC